MAHDYNAPRHTNSSPIARLRMAKGLTQGELAEMIGSTQVTVSRWETGERKPGSAYLVKLAKALDCSLDDLIF